MTDASLAQFGLVRSQGADDALGEVGCTHVAHAEAYHADARWSAVA